MNWTFPVASDGWDLLQGYETEDSEANPSEPEKDDLVEALKFAAGQLQEGTREGRRTHRVALKSVLEALLAEEQSEEQQARIRKKEYKAAREEERRQFAQSAKRHSDETRPMEIELKPQEILHILPHLSKTEKKALYRALRKDAEATAEEQVPEQDETWMKRPDRRTGGYSHQRLRPQEKPERAVPEAASSSTAVPAPKAGVKLPDAVRKKRLHEFREKLYENALDRKGRLQPSECSDIPSKEQEACPHEKHDLRWGANQVAHWATCGKCGLRKVLYYSLDHGALAADAEEPAWLSAEGELQVILDTGCRTAVAGALWHGRFQRYLQEQGLPYTEVQHTDIFRFGAGEPVVSTRAFVYPVVLGESRQCSWLRLAEVANTSRDARVEQCPALVGPSEMARWGIQMNFGSGETVVAGHVSPTQLSETRHPVLRVTGSQPPEAWREGGLPDLRNQLIRDPFSLALLQEGTGSEGESTTEPASAVDRLSDQDELEACAEWQHGLEDEAIACADSVPQEALLSVPAAPEPGESSDGSLSEGASETRHEDGPDRPWSTDEESSEEDEYAQVLSAEVPGEREILTKGQRRRLLDATQKIADSAATESEGKGRPMARARTRQPGAWRLVEIFTWTCALTQVACQAGWSTFEPVTLDSGWNLELRSDREKAFRYLQEIDPDVVVLAWPCSPWSTMQNANMKTELQREALHHKRRRARRTLLAFVKQVVLWQRSRGAIAIGENPISSKAWRTPEIEEAFSGTAQVDFDQCMLGLRHPTSGIPMRKRTRMREDALALRFVQRAQCDGGHGHHPIEGGFRHPDGHWMAVSEWAGGYPKALCRALLRGCGAALRAASEAFAQDELDEEVSEMADGQEAIEEEEAMEDADPERFPEYDG